LQREKRKKEGETYMTNTIQPLRQNLTPAAYSLLQQSITQDEERALQEGAIDARKPVQQIPFRFPAWPTSIPGPLTTPPPPGTRPINSLRSEQVVEIATSQVSDTFGEELRTMPDPYQQERVNFDQAEPPLQPRKQPKQRL
jgi:hypothetical protein